MRTTAEILESLEFARDQFLLSLLVRGVVQSTGRLDSPLVACALGPWSVGQAEFDSLDFHRASWALEVVATQNLAVALDTALEATFFADRLKTEDLIDRDYFQFVRCLRNAFSHEPYSPTWHLRDPDYRRAYQIADGWSVDLSSRHETEVDAADYRHAGGLVHLLDAGANRIRGIVGA